VSQSPRLTNPPVANRITHRHAPRIFESLPWAQHQQPSHTITLPPTSFISNRPPHTLVSFQQRQDSYSKWQRKELRCVSLPPSPSCLGAENVARAESPPSSISHRDTTNHSGLTANLVSRDLCSVNKFTARGYEADSHIRRSLEAQSTFIRLFQPPARTS